MIATRNDTPIYDALCTEMTAAPLCQVCGKPDLFGLVEQEHWLLCNQCWLMCFGYADVRRQKTCKVCGKFPLEWDDHMSWMRDRGDLDEYGWQVDVLCRNHFEQRARNRGMNPCTGVRHPIGVWFCFGCDQEYNGTGIPPADWTCKCVVKPEVSVK